MKKLFNRTLSVLCAVMLLISAVSAWAVAEEEAATPTDLIPQEGEIIPEEPGKEPEPEGDGITSVEVVITKTLTVGQSWEGKMKKTKPAVLKLDVTTPGPVYMLVEGKDVWATVEKSDRQTENPTRTQTDPETDRILYSWEAEEGSYLITLGPVEPNLLAAAKVIFMNQQAYDAWEKEQAEKEPEAEEKTEEEPAEEPDSEMEFETEPETIFEADTEANTEIETGNEPVEKENKSEKTEEEQISESEQPEKELASKNGLEFEEPAQEESFEDGIDTETEFEDIPKVDRIVNIQLTWDYDPPLVGDTAHFTSELIGYEGLNYTLQWQTSWDKEIWVDFEGATEPNLDVVITSDLKGIYWRLMIYVEMDEQA